MCGRIMVMSTVIQTREPRELLALIPYQLGFKPTDSAVVVSVRADRSRVGLIARVDLADIAHAERGPELAQALIGHLAADGAHQGIVVLYTDEDMQTGDALGRCVRSRGTDVLNHLQDAADHLLGDLECWVVASSGYYAIGCRDRSCCPVGGRPLSDLQGTQIGAQMVLEGVQVACTRDDLVRIPGVNAAAHKSARRARDRWCARGMAAQDTSDVYRWRRDGLELWREAFDRARTGLAENPSDLDGSDSGPVRKNGRVGVVPVRFGPCPWEPPGSAVAGRLLAALQDVLVRDAIVLTLVPGADRVADRVIAGDCGADVEMALRVITDPVKGRAPDRERTAAARTVLEYVVAHAGREGHAPGLTLLGVLAWWEGDGARAGMLVERALAADPGHRMAVLLEDALRAGMPPGWVRASSAQPSGVE